MKRALFVLLMVLGISGSAVAAPAAQPTQWVILGVASDNYPYLDSTWNPDRSSTQHDHGGMTYIVTVVVGGYSNTSKLYYNGAQVAKAVDENGFLMDDIGFDENGDNIIDYWYQYYQIPNFNMGTVYYKEYSSTHDSLWIQ